MRTETIIAIDFSKKIILIGNSSYAGEMKKSVFTTLNFYLPAQGVMPMHCSANVGQDGDVALFFGLSGTGKTTLSADPNRMLIGDDEHGWGPDGVFNFEGGCYAKCIKLSRGGRARNLRRDQPLRRGAGKRGVRSRHARLRTSTTSPRPRTRARPIRSISCRGASRTGRAGHPKNIIFLTADAFGVMPPIAKLTPAQAMYHFLSGYTAKVAGHREGPGRGRARILHLLRARRSCRGRRRNTATCCATTSPSTRSTAGWSTRGWTGGIYGVGRRMPIKATRALVTGALDGSLKSVSFRTDPYFGFSVPTSVPGIEPHLLYPMKTWKDKAAFDETARKLVRMFQENFVKYEKHVDADVRSAAPEVRIAAE